jgi:hypothetical protein
MCLSSYLKGNMVRAHHKAQFVKDFSGLWVDILGGVRNNYVPWGITKDFLLILQYVVCTVTAGL